MNCRLDGLGRLFRDDWAEAPRPEYDQEGCAAGSQLISAGGQEQKEGDLGYVAPIALSFQGTCVSKTGIHPDGPLLLLLLLFLNLELEQL